MKAKFTALLFSILLLYIKANAQLHISGIVKSAENKGAENVLPGATITWLGTLQGTTSGSDGTFSLPKNASVNSLVISFIGFISDTIIVSGSFVNVVLKPTTTGIAEVSVDERRLSTMQMLNAVTNTTIMREAELQKAACCNLSESFETNPSVDVNYADAVSGAKQIQMLGLSGIYTQVQRENVPGTRGLAANYGLSYTPGTWIESIQVTKGVGSVVNGFESIAGQINVEQKKPEGNEAVYANLYMNRMGRTEGNLNLARKINSKLSTALYMHADYWKNSFDRNGDGFMDVPLTQGISVMNRWKYEGDIYKIQAGISFLNDSRIGGQTGFNPLYDRGKTDKYGVGINTNRYEAFAKIGRVYPGDLFKSTGLIVSVVSHNQDSYFGLREYKAQQNSAYANFIYQNIIGTSNHKFRTGMSLQADAYDETLFTAKIKRTEVVTGGFYEYTYTPNASITVMTGIRADYNNLYGAYLTPRIHAKYEITPTTSLRISGGRGQRTANIFAENASVLASGRVVYTEGNNKNGAYHLDQEIAWNYGMSLTQDFEMFGNNGTIVLDAYRTDFQNQVIPDMENAGYLRFYNLKGASYSNSLQAEINYRPIRRFDIRLAYRLFDVYTDYISAPSSFQSYGRLSRPYVAKNRAFLNLAYETRSKWKFDYTVQYIGRKRLPGTLSNSELYRMPEYSPSYLQMNAQVTKSFLFGLDVYIGVENLTDFRQTTLFIDPQNPFSNRFDGSFIWGPIVGRMSYIGLRYKLAGNS